MTKWDCRLLGLTLCYCEPSDDTSGAETKCMNARPDPIYFGAIGALPGLTLLFELIDDLRDEKRKDKKAHRKEDFKGKQLLPIPANPNFFEGPNKKGENKRPNDDAQSGAEEIVPESDLCQSHAEIHGSEWKINEP